MISDEIHWKVLFQLSVLAQLTLHLQATVQIVRKGAKPIVPASGDVVDGKVASLAAEDEMPQEKVSHALSHIVWPCRSPTSIQGLLL